MTRQRAGTGAFKVVRTRGIVPASRASRRNNASGQKDGGHGPGQDLADQTTLHKQLITLPGGGVKDLDKFLLKLCLKSENHRQGAINQPREHRLKSSCLPFASSGVEYQ